MMLLDNGTLAHRVVLPHARDPGPWFVYKSGKYCLDDLVVTHNLSSSAEGGSAEGDIVEFGYICSGNQVELNENIPGGMKSSFLSQFSPAFTQPSSFL